MDVTHRALWLLNQYGIAYTQKEMLGIMLADGLYNKANEKYIDSEFIMDKGESFKQLPLTIVLGIYSFFLQRRNEYMKITNHSSMAQEAVNLQAQLIDSSIKSGVGMSQLKAYLMEIYWSKIKYSIKISTTYSNISVSLLTKLMLKSLKATFYNKLILIKNKFKII
jgi:hypothetical protein